MTEFLAEQFNLHHVLSPPFAEHSEPAAMSAETTGAGEQRGSKEDYSSCIEKCVDAAEREQQVLLQNRDDWLFYEKKVVTQ